jgi:hypothetical protein
VIGGEMEKKQGRGRAMLGTKCVVLTATMLEPKSLKTVEIKI